MPTAEGYIHADTPHEKTVAGDGYLYGCHSDKSGVGHRGRDTTIAVQEGWTPDGRRAVRDHLTEWLPKSCGHSLRITDPACTGCKNREEDDQPLPRAGSCNTPSSFEATRDD